MKDRAKIVEIAYKSRCILLGLQYISNHAISDHRADAFRTVSSHNSTELSSLMEHLLGGFVRWDAQYFMHIAKFGYTYENTLAFFPLYPVVAGFLGDSLAELIGHWHIEPALLLIFIVGNIFLFKKAAVALYDLTAFALNDRELAFTSAMLFCFNPASIFFIAPYSETLFSYLTFLGMLKALRFFKKYSNPGSVYTSDDLLGLVPIALSTATRSNGLLNICFLLYTFICSYTVSNQRINRCYQTYFSKTKLLCLMLTSTIFCLLPFLIFQIYSYATFCKSFPVGSLSDEVLKQAKDNEWILPGQHAKYNQSWCNDLVPLAYNYVQKHYWNVGFMQYYEWKQWPNFLLAAPMLSIIAISCLKYVWIHLLRKRSIEIFTLNDTTDCYSIYQKPHMNGTVFHVHALFLALYSMFFVHIQVSTRLLAAASPVFYWACSKQFLDPKLRTLNTKFYIMFYCAAYFIVGTVLFCNFFPWT